MQMTQVQLAAVCSVTQQTISAIELGTSIPGDLLKFAIAAALSIEPGELFAWPEAVA